MGSAFTIAVPDNNTQPLESFAAQYGQGLSNMLEANPGVDVYLPRSGSTLTIPQQLILPDTVREDRHQRRRNASLLLPAAGQQRRSAANRHWPCRTRNAA